MTDESLFDTPPESREGRAEQATEAAAQAAEAAAHPHLPDPTPWPLVLALGITLLVTGPALLAAGQGQAIWLGTSLIGLLVFVAALYKLIMEDVRQFNEEEQ